MNRIITPLVIAIFAVGNLVMVSGCSPNKSVDAQSNSAQNVASEQSSEDQSRPPGGRFIMRTHTGAIVTDEDFQGKYLLVSFGYMTCPDICPMNLETMAQVQTLLGEKATKTQVLFVSVDPDRDTPALLGPYVKSFDPNFIGLSGTKVATDSMVKAYKVHYAFNGKDDPQDMDYSVDHSAQVFFMSDTGEFIQRFGYGMTADQIATIINKIIPD